VASFYLLKPDNEANDDENGEDAECQQNTQSYDASSTCAAWFYTSPTPCILRHSLSTFAI